MDERPESVEAAGALLGAAITICGTGATTENAPPKGMHSSFATATSIPSSQLLMRLYYLRALLRASPPEEPLVAAPSLLAVLMQILGTSNQLAAKNAAAGTTMSTITSSSSSSGAGASPLRQEIPPMLSTPLRKLWVDCVVLCHTLGEGLSGTARTSLFAFLKNMIALAGMNPRSAKAAGGARIAALDVIAGLFNDESLAPKIAGWAHDALQLCLRALRSSGNGEPSFRIAAVRMACAVAKASRVSYLKSKPDVMADRPRDALLLVGALETPAVLEAIKVLKQGSADKFPEVRSASATFAALLAPMLVIHPKSRSGSSGGSTSDPNAPVANLDEAFYIALKNIDDEKAEVAAAWSEALARCICTAVAVGERKASSAMAKRDVEVDQDDPSASRAAAAAAAANPAQRNSRKKEGPVSVCKDFKSAILFLLKNFVKVGGEVSAGRAGGIFSMGGRAVRVGLGNSLTQLLRIQFTLGVIGHEDGLSVQEILLLVLKMAGVEAEKQFVLPISTQTLDITTTATADAKVAGGNALFGSKKSEVDAGLVRLSAGNVIRCGISELATETTQLSLLQDLLQLLDPPSASALGINCTANQLQVILVEISHLLTALGEASASKVEDLTKMLTSCLSHPSHGVRHEAAVACGSFVACFPVEGRKMLKAALDDIETNHAQLLGVANRGDHTESITDPSKRSFGRMFRRPKKEAEKPLDLSLPFQYAVHGNSLMVSIVARELPRAPGGISKEQLAATITLAEMLVACQFNDVIAKANPSVVCTCVRGGFGVITGLLATGPAAMETHTKKIFELLQKSSKQSMNDGGSLGVDHDLSCVEVVLSSLVAFLSYCSELLLSVPEVLSQISIMLEELLAAFSKGGRFGEESLNPAAIIRRKSAKASLMEAFAWLPSGSFPMAADNVFAFAAREIQTAIAGEVTCSILPSLITKEDLLLDAKALPRVDRAGQVGGARDIEEIMVTLTSEGAQHGERESVIHFPGSHIPLVEDKEFRHSQILGMFAFDPNQLPPTPLHAAVGTWRKPLDVSCSSTVRLIDASIQAFSATFGLKGGMEQQEAMEMLESLVPPFLTQLATSIGMTTALTEQASRVKPKEDNAAVANITAVLLSCLKALPLHEATHNVPIGLGPPWMNKAKDLLLTLLPSASNIVRRSAAEGLALLATLGVSEDAHFLQSAVLHSLDEVMRGNQPDGKPKALPFEPISASRAGSLLTLACIQRMAQKVSETKNDRNKGRVLSAEEVILQDEETLPTLQMMTRILPSVARQGFRDFFIVQTHALHAFGLLLGYSSKLEKDRLEAEDLQLLRKGVELIEDNFVASWTAASVDFDAGQEGEKLGAEVSLLAVLLRLMTLLVPSLHHIHSENPGIASRFSCFATLIMETIGSHPIVAVECMAFFEVLAGNQHLLPQPSRSMHHTDNPLFSAIPFCIASLKPQHPDIFAVPSWCDLSGVLLSTRGVRSVLRAVKILSLGGAVEDDMQFASLIFAFLETACASRCFTGATLHRPLAAPRAAELVAVEGLAVEKEGTEVLRVLLTAKHDSSDYNEALLRWILFARSLVANTSSANSGFEEESAEKVQTVEAVVKRADIFAFRDAAEVFAYVSQIRWQIKSLAIILTTGAISEMLNSNGTNRTDCPNFNYKAAKEEIQNTILSTTGDPASRLVLHLTNVVALACTSAVAAIDQAELPTLQLAGVLLLSNLVACFRGIHDPEQPDEYILNQHGTQLLSSVKHSLGDPEELSGEAYYGRYFGGCQAIQTIANSELANDPMALKRIIRPTIPAAKELPFFEFLGSCPKFEHREDESFDNKRAVLLVHIGKVWTSGKLLLMRNMSETKAKTMKNLVEDETGLAVHSAAIAFDGARLLLGEGVSLCGSKATEDSSLPKNIKGFLYENIQDIDNSVKAAMVKTWSSCGCFALRSLYSLTSSETELTNKQACSVWVKQLVSLVLAGLSDCLASFSGTEAFQGPGWCKSVESSEVAVDCLHSLIVLVEKSTEDSALEKLGVDMNHIMQRLRDSVTLPALGQNANKAIDYDKKGNKLVESFLTLPERRQADVIREINELIECTAATPLKPSAALLMLILTPLDLLQRGLITCNQQHAESIISTSLIAANSLISLSKCEDSFVKSMVQIALAIKKSEKAVPDKVYGATRALMQGCLSHKATTPKDRRRIAHELAESGDWESWKIVCTIDDGLAASGSMAVLKKTLLNTSKPEEQLQALSAIRQLVQSPSNMLVGRIMNDAGAEILHFFKMYGTLVPGATLSKASKTRRTAACADAMKIVLVAFQQLVSAGTEEQMFVGFLAMFFEYLTMVLRFNGLPNHPPPQAESDPTLGRMVAQAIVHVARTAPVPFKTTLASLADPNGRALIEYAVRAEMTGYATAAPPPAKKKISLKGFKSS